jgi:hypothetical protein
MSGSQIWINFEVDPNLSSRHVCLGFIVCEKNGPYDFCNCHCLLFYINIFQVQHVHLEEHHVLRKRSIDQNLRIKLYYDDSVYK